MTDTTKSPGRLVFDAFLRDHLLTALKSGEHNHGTGGLEYEGSDGKIRRCCLGVACFIHPDVRPGGDAGEYEYGGHSSLVVLPEPLAKAWDIQRNLEYDWMSDYGISPLHELITNTNDQSDEGYDPVIKVFEHYLAGDILFYPHEPSDGDDV